MIFHRDKIDGLYIIDQELRTDERGYFSRNFCYDEILKATGIKFNIKQINQSLSKEKGILRGMHFQIEPKAETKIVQCLSGRIFDVAVDIRKESSTYGQWVATELSNENKKLFFIPKGFAHGFMTLTENCLMQYYLSEFYAPDCERGLRWDDPFLNIEWPMKPKLLSEKDKNWPLIKE